MEFDLQPILLSFKLALITCVFLLVVGIPIAYFLASTKSKFKFFFEAFLSLPLVLPPSVLGFYLLVALAPDSLVGGIINSIFNIKLVFSFEGIVLASVIYSFPFMGIHFFTEGKFYSIFSLLFGESRCLILISSSL